MALAILDKIIIRIQVIKRPLYKRYRKSFLIKSFEKQISAYLLIVIYIESQIS